MITNDTVLKNEITVLHIKRNQGNTMISTGIGICIISILFGEIGSLISSAANDKKTSNYYLIFGGSGTIIATSLICGGLVLKSKTKKLGLQPVHLYNSK